MSFRATILTLYPEMFPGHLGTSLAGKAAARGDWSLDAVQIRDFATDKHRTVDDTRQKVIQYDILIVMPDMGLDAVEIGV